MKKIIAILALAAFTVGAHAGSDCCPGKSKEKQTCPGKENKCPAGGDQKKEDSKA